MLLFVLVFNTAFLSSVVNSHLPLRDWHASVGSCVGMLTCFRIFMPHCVLAQVPIRVFKRKQNVLKCSSQEQQFSLFENPEFIVSENYAEVATTIWLTMIYGPAMPILYPFCAIALLLRYCCDWYLFLRASKRPPAYDETI